MTDNQSREERRKNVRLKKNLSFQIAFRFSAEDNKESPLQEANIINMSSSGVCIEMEGFNETWKEDLLMGRIIMALKINFPEKEDPIYILARAVWITKTEVAVQAEDKVARHLIGARFIEITSKEEDAIMHYLIKHFL